MILGAGNQNKNLRSASTIRVSSQEKQQTAKQYSAAISSVNTSGKFEDKKIEEIRKIQSKPRSTVRNLAGLNNEKSTYLQFNGSGYSAESLQTARYSNREKTTPTVKGANFLFTNQANKGIINNYTKNTSLGTSSDRMNKNLNLNRYF